MKPAKLTILQILIMVLDVLEKSKMEHFPDELTGHYGLCSIIDDLHRRRKVNAKEKTNFLNYLWDNQAEQASLECDSTYPRYKRRNSDDEIRYDRNKKRKHDIYHIDTYLWKSGKFNPREEWLKKHIKLLSS